ncbi:MAG: hypothetical protein JWM95_724 [Gemmatimonadetes bacterium]|nr:hypothetical protein [Gemmatimonadota bacterium]
MRLKCPRLKPSALRRGFGKTGPSKIVSVLQPFANKMIRIVEISDVLPDLVARFADREGVIWTGAGVSARLADAAVGVLSGAAFRQRLLDEMALAGHHVAGLELAEVASLYELQFSRAQLNHALRQSFLTEIGAPPPFYSLISELPAEVATFVTTNFDPYLESALIRRDPIVVVGERSIGVASRGRPIVYKVHGDAGEPVTCAITTQDYDRWNENNLDVSRVLGTLLLQRAVIAVGYRAQDAHFRQLIVHLARRSRARDDGRIRVYVAVPGPTEDEFAAYGGEDVELVVINATGLALLESLGKQLEFELQRREVERVRAVSESQSIVDARQTLSLLLTANSQVGNGDANTQAIDEARNALITVLVRHGKLYDAIQEMSRRARASIGRNAALAVTYYVTTLRFGLDVLRDPGFTATMQRSMLLDQIGVGQHRIPPGGESEDLSALVGIRQGSPLSDVPRLAELADERARAPMDSEQHFALDRRYAVLAAEMYLNRQEYANAAEAYSRAAFGESNADTRSEYEIRSLWARGRSGDAATALEALDSGLYSEATDALRWRAYGWLTAEHGSHLNAVGAFERAASISLAHVDLVGAMAAYGGIVWSYRFAASWVPSEMALARQAMSTRRALIEHANRSEGAPRLNAVDSFIEDADRNIIRQDFRAASLDARTALRVGENDLDPFAVDEAQERLAAIWPLVLEAAPSNVDSYVPAAFALMDAHTAHDATLQRLSAVLREVVAEGASTPERHRLLALIATRAVGASGLVGALRVVKSLLPLLDGESADNVVTDLLVRATQYPWSITARTDPRRIAVLVVSKVAHHASAQSLARLRDAWFAMLFDAPVAYRQEALVGLANILLRAESDERGSDAMLAKLLPSLEPLRQDGHALSALFAVIAILARTASPEAAKAAREAMLNSPHLARWLAAERLVQSRVTLENSLLSEYLADTISRMRALTVTGDPKTLLMYGFEDFPALTQAAVAQLPTSELTAAAAAVALLLGHDEQHAMVRAPWMPFAWTLARGNETCRAILSPTVLRLAQGNYSTPHHPLWDDGGDPLGEVFSQKGDAGDLREWGLKFFAALYSTGSEEECSRTLKLIHNAASESDSHVRASAQRALGLLFERTTIQQDRSDGVDIALAACGDRERSVREAAKSALELRARANARTRADGATTHEN